MPEDEEFEDLEPENQIKQSKDESNVLATGYKRNCFFPRAKII